MERTEQKLLPEHVESREEVYDISNYGVSLIESNWPWIADVCGIPEMLFVPSSSSRATAVNEITRLDQEMGWRPN